MKYFIDFEATQFTNEILSVGCIAEDGSSFESYVHASKVSKFITSLTGITKEINAKAASSDEVFSNFFDWLMDHNDINEPVIFYCYGTSDKEFIKRNLSTTKNLKAQAALSIIAMSLEDYCPYVKNHFGLIKNIKLNKIVAYYRGVETIEQAHNAFEDAKYLKEIYDHISTEARVTSHPFPTYEMKLTEVGKADIGQMRKVLTSLPHTIEIRDTNEKVIAVFHHISSATQWVKKNYYNGPANGFSHKSSANKIIKANAQNKQYCGYYWDIYLHEEEEDDINE